MTEIYRGVMIVYVVFFNDSLSSRFFKSLIQSPQNFAYEGNIAVFEFKHQISKQILLQKYKTNFKNF